MALNRETNFSSVSRLQQLLDDLANANFGLHPREDLVKLHAVAPIFTRARTSIFYRVLPSIDDG